MEGLGKGREEKKGKKWKEHGGKKGSEELGELRN